MMGLDSGPLEPALDFNTQRLEEEEYGKPGQQDTPEPPPRARKKRVLTVARQEQNRLAQRAFRLRRKERHQELKAAATSSSNVTRKVLRCKPALATEGKKTVEDASMIEADPMGPALIDIQAIRTGATEMDSSPYSSLTESSSSVSVITDTELMLPFSFESSSRAQGSCRGRSPSHSLPPALDLLANRLEFRDTIFLMAMLRNASALGFNIDDVGSCRYDTMSPLYSPATPASDPAGLLSYWGRRQRNAALPPDLQPTLNQMLIPHHVSLDLIPFPALRDRIIVLSAAMPATFNMWELKLDIYTRGGLTVVRGKGSGASKGGFQPWDRRSWVATPWFLRKWKLLVEEDREQLGRGE